MARLKNNKREWLAKRKRELVEENGCSECGGGKVPEGFVKYWKDFAPEPYESRLYVFRNPEGISVSDVLNRGGTTQHDIEAVLKTSVLLCRVCSARRMTSDNRKANANACIQEREPS